MFILCRIRTVGNAAARFTAFIIYCCTVQVSYAQRREHQAPPVFAACFAEQYAQRAILSRRIDRFPVLFFRKTEFADGKLRIVFRSALFQRSAHRLQNSIPVCPKNAFRIRRIKSIRRACLFAFVFNHRITHRKLYPLILRRIAVCKDMKAKDRAVPFRRIDIRTFIRRTCGRPVRNAAHGKRDDRQCRGGKRHNNCAQRNCRTESSEHRRAPFSVFFLFIHLKILLERNYLRDFSIDKSGLNHAY